LSKADSPPDITGLRFVRKLGSGGYADVFLYDQATPQRQVAVKVLRETGLSSAAITRFTAEADAMARLEHPYIVPVYATGTSLDHRPYIAMMYYPRPSLAERARGERLPVAEVLQLGIQLGSAVETAHRAGLLHRDIKPANVLTSAYGRPGLTDFGIAGQLSDADDDDVGVSVPWSPPETLYATGPATVRSDVYSLSATLWHLLVGRSPFEIPGGDNAPFALMRRIRDVSPPSTGRADVPASLDRLLRAAMGKDAVLRPASAAEFVGALQAIEQELRLPRTPLELANTEHLAPSLPGPATSDRTQVRSPQVLGVTPVMPTTTAPDGFAPVEDVAAMATRRSNRRVTPVGTFDPGVEGRTVLRAPGLEPVGPAVVVPEHVGGGKRALLIGLGVVILAVLGVVIWQVVTAPKPVRPDPPVTISESPPDVGQSSAPPGKPEVSCRAGNQQVTCAWTYANPLPNDQFLWRTAGTTDTNPVITKPEVVVPTQASHFCIEVKVYRFDGTNPPKDWTKGCTP
jgi:eukaryotic-like serine/threonine-protein kinase